MVQGTWTKKTFNTGEVALSYLVGPPNGPPVVAFHGTSTSKEGRLVDPFMNTFTLYKVDQRGHGESGRATTGYRALDFGRDGTAFLREVVRGPAVVVGHSLGGMVAIYSAAAAPDRVRALVLVDPPLFLGERFAGSYWEHNFAEMRAETTSGLSVEQLAAKMVSEGTPEEAAQRRAKQLLAVDPLVYDAILSSEFWAGFDTDRTLEMIKCPVLLIHDTGSQNAAVSAQDVVRAQSHIPHMEDIKVEGGGHVPQVRRPAEFTQIVGEFLAGV